jgi:hypothetical protein
VFRTSNKQNPKINTSRHVTNKTLNIQNKDRILKAENEATCYISRQTHQNNSIFLNANPK